MTEQLTTVDDQSLWRRYVAELQAKEAELISAEAGLRWLRDQVEMDGATLAIWQDAIGKAESTRAQVGWILSAVKSVDSWISEANAPSFADQQTYGPGEFWFLNESAGGGLQGLSAVWLAPVPLAALVAAIALMTSALSYIGERVGVLNTSLGTYQQMRSNGIAHREAIEAANALVPESMLESIKKISYAGVAIVAAIFLLPKLLEAVKR